MRVGQTTTWAGPAPAPLVLDRYRLRRQLGAGAFGTVWMAVDERLQREVAVKILPRERVIGGRFEREAQAAARLSHPGIVTLYEAAENEEGAYLVSELVRGPTLERALAAGWLSDRAVLVLGAGLCDALAHAHDHGVVHRDLKPSNILLAGGRAAPVAKLTDFGVARVLGGRTLTQTGELVGTAAYMPPEQAEGLGAGEAADLYSLALVLYEALSGVNPLTQPAPGQRRLALRLAPLRRHRRELPRELGQAIDLALRPRPRERGTLAELRDALLRASERVSDETEPEALGDSVRIGAQISQPPESAETAAPVAPGTPLPTRALAAPGAPLPTRALAAATTAALAAWVAVHLIGRSSAPAATAALAAGLAVLIAPRLAWLALTAAASVVLILQGHPGTALVLAGAGLLPALLLPRGGALWPLAALAPGLGALGLAGAWPALAAVLAGGRLSRLWRRAALAAVGWVWLVVAAPLAGHDLYLQRPFALWPHSVAQTLDHLFLTGGWPAGAAAWALAAAALPLAVGRPATLPARVLAVGAWSAVTTAGTVAALRLAGAGALTPSAPRLLLGALGGATVAFALSTRFPETKPALRGILRSMGQP